MAVRFYRIQCPCAVCFQMPGVKLKLIMYPQAFSGSGNRLDGKKKGVEPSPSPIKPGDIRRYVCVIQVKDQCLGRVLGFFPCSCNINKLISS